MTLTNKIFIAMAAGIAVGTLGNFLQPALHGSQWGSLLEGYFFFGALEIVGKSFYCFAQSAGCATGFCFASLRHRKSWRAQ